MKILNILISSIIIWSIILLSGCMPDPPSGGSSFDDCLYGAPEAIFNESVPGVSSHTFALKPAKSEECFILNQSYRVCIEQSGCDQIQQVFTFEALRSNPDELYINWTEYAIKRYRELGELGAPFLSFYAISERLDEQRDRLQPEGPPVVLQPGLTFSLSVSKQKNGVRLITKIKEEAPVSG